MPVDGVESIDQRERKQRDARRTAQYGLLADDFGTRHAAFGDVCGVVRTLAIARARRNP
jgi:hypothetical protein